MAKYLYPDLRMGTTPQEVRSNMQVKKFLEITDEQILEQNWEQYLRDQEVKYGKAYIENTWTTEQLKQNCIQEWAHTNNAIKIN